MTSATNWRKIALGRTKLDGTTAFTKVDIAKTNFTGWYPDPAPYPYSVDSFASTGGAGFHGSTALSCCAASRIR